MSKANDEEVVALIHGGVTVTTLAQIFGLDHKDVNKRLVGKITPVSGHKDRYVRYKIKDAAPFLIDLKVDPEEYLKNLSPSKLPPALQDAFWKSLLSRQKYEENKGDLWRTSRVFEVVSSAFKVIRLTILMFNETVSQQTQLTDRQREIIQGLTDGLLLSLRDALVEEFEMYVPPNDEHGKPLSEEDVTVAVGPIVEEDEDDE